MFTQDLDIVYCVKDEPDNEELRYSLRSLCNIPHRFVWIYGGCPKWLNHGTVKCMELSQKLPTKWDNTRYLLGKIAQNPSISENFIWFNDDFFVTKPIKKLGYWYDGTLHSRGNRTIRNGEYSQWGTRVILTGDELAKNNKLPLNYELHLPIIFNREKLAVVLKLYDEQCLPRSLYCNHWQVVSHPRADVKVENVLTRLSNDVSYCSTDDLTFGKGNIGKELRNIFSQPCKYEK